VAGYAKVSVCKTRQIAKRSFAKSDASIDGSYCHLRSINWRVIDRAFIWAFAGRDRVHFRYQGIWPARVSNPSEQIGSRLITRFGIDRSGLVGENHRRITECLEFKTIASRIFDKERALFARFTLKADFRFEKKRHIGGFQAIGKVMPDIPFQNRTEMRDRNRITIDSASTLVLTGFGADMGRQLMTKEIKINPCLGRTSFGTAKNVDVKGAGIGNRFDREGQMERGQ
tara:strand:- start:364 stop:1047 length:684 start_codon:yes stop_codon:yes gene_type:complete